MDRHPLPFMTLPTSESKHRVKKYAFNEKENSKCDAQHDAEKPINDRGFQAGGCWHQVHIATHQDAGGQNKQRE